MSRTLTCILCPRGCRLMALQEDHEVKVQGAGCPKGVDYAREELTSPVRIVTATVSLEGGTLTRLPVKTADPVPKKMVLPVAAALRHVSIQAPVKAGETVADNIAGTNTSVVATRSVPAKGSYS